MSKIIENFNFNRNEPVFFNVDEIAKLLHVSKSTVYRWTCKRAIPHFKAGGRLLFDIGDIWIWCSKNRKLASYDYETTIENKLCSLTNQQDESGRTQKGK